jgi:hypothetical protein
VTIATRAFSNAATARGHLTADDLVSRLCNPPRTSASGPFAAAFQVVISFGLLPMILWPMRWASFVDGERKDLLDLMARWRSRVAAGDARQLDKLARRLRPQPMLMVLPWLMAGFIGMLMGVLIAGGDRTSDIAHLTFVHIQPLHFDSSWTNLPHGNLRFSNASQFSDEPATGQDLRWQITDHLFSIWAWGLLFAYAVHWYAIRSHARAIHSLVNWSNRLATANGLPLVRNEALNTGLGAMWIILAVVLCFTNAWWGIPLALGGAMQRRYTRIDSIRIRSALGCQLREGFAMVPAIAPTSRFCGSANCGARLPDVANFCPRCGSAAVSSA